MTTATLERYYRIYDDETGEFVSVSNDEDGLNFLELRYHTQDGKIHDRMMMNVQMARLLVKAINHWLEDKETVSP